MYLDSGSSSSWWYALVMSSVLNTVDPFRSVTSSSIVGIGCFSRTMAVLAARMSTQMRVFPFFFGTETIGLTHGVAPSAFSMMSSLISLSISASTSFRIWNGILLWRWWIGGTSIDELVTDPNGSTVFFHRFCSLSFRERRLSRHLLHVLLRCGEEIFQQFLRVVEYPVGIFHSIFHRDHDRFE